MKKIITWKYMYKLPNSETRVPVRGGIEFTTTEKTCGPYGFTDTTDTDTVEGHMLLTVYGRAGGGFDKINFVFDRCV